MKNFKPLYNIGDSLLSSIINELEEHPELWDAYPVRTTLKYGPFADSSDIVLQYQDLEKPFDHYETISYPPLLQLPSVQTAIWGLMSVVRGTRLGRSCITRLKPGQQVLAHCDSKLFSDYYDRFHISLKDNGRCPFVCGSESYSPEPGTCFWFDNKIEHSVLNSGDTDRWTLIIDIKKAVVFTGEYEHKEREVYETPDGSYHDVKRN
jgi:hypothetical protein